MKSAKAAKVAFYAVRRGRKPGVYPTWTECESEVKGFDGARYKKFMTEAEAWNFVNGNDSGASSEKSDKSSEKSEGDTATEKDKTAKAAKDEKKSSSSSSSTAAGQKRSAILLPDDFHATQAKRPKDGPVSVYTDGCCFNNGKDNPCAGIGVYWGPGDPNNLSERLGGRQTNNRAEIIAAMRAIQQAKEQGITELKIYTDSNFLISCMTEWLPKWKTTGWKGSNGKEVLNREELEQLDAETTGITVTYEHVPGHQGVEGNEAADKLANDGARKKLDDDESSSSATDKSGKGSSGNAADKKVEKKAEKPVKEDKKSAAKSSATPTASADAVTVYTSGSCFNIGKEQRGGVGVYWGPDDPNNLSERLTGPQTKNRTDIMAALRAVEQAKERGLKELQIHTDNIFLFNSMMKWVPKWRTNGWQTSTGNEVQNKEELEQLDTATTGITVTYVHVTAESGGEGKEAASKLSKEGAKKKVD